MSKEMKELLSALTDLVTSLREIADAFLDQVQLENQEIKTRNREASIARSRRGG